MQPVQQDVAGHNSFFVEGNHAQPRIGLGHGGLRRPPIRADVDDVSVRRRLAANGPIGRTGIDQRRQDQIVGPGARGLDIATARAPRVEIAVDGVRELRIQRHAVTVGAVQGAPARQTAVIIVAADRHGLLGQQGAVAAKITVEIALERGLRTGAGGEIVYPAIDAIRFQHAVGDREGTDIEKYGDGTVPHHGVLDGQRAVVQGHGHAAGRAVVLPKDRTNHAGVHAEIQAQSVSAVVFDPDPIKDAADGLVGLDADLRAADGQVPQADVDGVIHGEHVRGRNRRGLENRARRGIGTALDRHVEIAVARIALVDRDRRGSGHVGAGIHVHHVFRIQFVGIENRLQAGLGFVRRQPMIGVVARGRAKDVPVRAGIVHVVGNRAAVAQEERRKRSGHDAVIFHAVDAPSAQGRTAIRHAVPQITSGCGRPAANHVGPGDTVVRGVLDANRIVGGGAAGRPLQIYDARGAAAIDKRHLRDPAAERRLAGFRRTAV